VRDFSKHRRGFPAQVIRHAVTKGYAADDKHRLGRLEELPDLPLRAFLLASRTAGMSSWSPKFQGLE